MDAAEAVRSAADSLAVNKVRSALTVLGVVIGVAAVIVLVSLGEAARIYIEKELGDLGSNILVVVPGKTAREGGMHMGASAVRKLTFADASLIERRSRNVLSAIPVIVGTSWVRYRGKNRDTYVVGVTGPYFEARNLKIESGRAIDRSDFESARKVCVLGSTVNRDILKGKNPLGAMVTLGNSKYRVIGIMAPKGVALGVDLDDVIFIPASSARQLFDTDMLFNITVKVRNPELVDEARRDISGLLKRRHAGKEDFTIMSQDEMLDVMGKILSIMTGILASIAAISLLVGGIGIMNIMLVSVRERTREIGLRKALGARRRDILLQFLAESLVLSLFGGAVGVLSGWLLTQLAALLINDLPAHTSWWGVVMAFCFSAVVGIFFGVWPARKASLMDPVAALRSF